MTVVEVANGEKGKKERERERKKCTWNRNADLKKAKRTPSPSLINFIIIIRSGTNLIRS